MTPLATPRRLRRHGRAVALTTAAAALVGIAGASMAFQVDQSGTAAAAAADVVPTQQAGAPVLAPPLPDLASVGEQIREDLEEAAPPPEPQAKPPAEPGAAAELLEVVPDVLPVPVPDLAGSPPSSDAEPAAERPEPRPATDLVESLPLEPILEAAAPLPVDEVLAPVLEGADEILGAVPAVPEVTEEVVAIVEPLTDPLCEALGAATEPVAVVTDPLLGTLPPVDRTSDIQEPCRTPTPGTLTDDLPPEASEAEAVVASPGLLEPVRTGLLGR